MSPSPAPPPLHPQRVEAKPGEPDGYIAFETTLDLGITGMGVTLTKAEDGSYCIGDSAFKPGGSVECMNAN